MSAAELRLDWDAEYGSADALSLQTLYSSDRLAADVTASEPEFTLSDLRQYRLATDFIYLCPQLFVQVITL